MVSAFLLRLGKVCDDLIVHVLFPGELLFQLLLRQVTQLEFAHELVHGVSVEELAIADLANFAANSVLQIDICFSVDSSRARARRCSSRYLLLVQLAMLRQQPRVVPNRA